MKIHNQTTPTFRIRASSLGKLMTEPRTKADKEAGELSATAKSFITLWYKETLYDRRKPIDSKYMTKGNSCEDASIAMLDNTWTNNKEQFSNDWMTGEPDVITDDEIIDIKNSWDFTTFPLFSKTCPKKDYEWQLLGYMWMVGRTKGRVIYTLMDTPDELVRYEFKKQNRGMLVIDEKGYPLDMTDDFAKDYQYEHLPKHLRIKEFQVEYDEEKIEMIKKKVAKAREFVQALSF